jgi:hypothetical protein
MLGKLEIENHQFLTDKLNELKKSLLADNYFKRIASMQPEARKSVKIFHAKDDVPEIRREVCKLLVEVLCGFLRLYMTRSVYLKLKSPNRQRNRDTATTPIRFMTTWWAGCLRHGCIRLTSFESISQQEVPRTGLRRWLRR